ncbi:hypothetical protein CDL12_27639 [Handroanthus impetiginosus]|uniref:Uncharacterized protein n=1 Tax=Handroanthus impetiginosus TaxID=429701 RepID=A0A2G9G3H2_9LAMI|nr:hypothetical protein CDL12_27639 [Handroanthus impetiginosus]
MGGTSGHVSLGFAFLIIGLWHLFNCTKHHSFNPRSYSTLPWFPISRFRFLEPITIMLVTFIFILSELFIGHRPLSPDGTIPFKNLRHFEHSMMAVSFFVYAFFAALFDKVSAPCQHGLLFFLQAVAFGQELLILHLHSTDHMGIEGQYHWLLQIITFVSIVTTLLAIGYPGSFLNAFIRGFSVIFQGVWLIVMGFMLWTPKWIPKGCFLKPEVGRDAILCHGERALDRAKALVNIQFGLYLTVLTVFAMCFYLVVIKLYRDEKVEYVKVPKVCEDQEEGDYGLEDKHKVHKVHKVCV